MLARFFAANRIPIAVNQVEMTISTMEMDKQQHNQINNGMVLIKDSINQLLSMYNFNQTCKYWLNDKCIFGEKCIFQHRIIKINKKCKFGDNCYYKDKCLYVHDEETIDNNQNQNHNHNSNRNASIQSKWQVKQSVKAPSTNPSDKNTTTDVSPANTASHPKSTQTESPIQPAPTKPASLSYPQQQQINAYAKRHNILKKKKKKSNSNTSLQPSNTNKSKSRPQTNPTATITGQTRAPAVNTKPYQPTESQRESSTESLIIPTAPKSAQRIYEEQKENEMERAGRLKWLATQPQIQQKNETLVMELITMAAAHEYGPFGVPPVVLDQTKWKVVDKMCEKLRTKSKTELYPDAAQYVGQIGSIEICGHIRGDLIEPSRNALKHLLFALQTNFEKIIQSIDEASNVKQAIWDRILKNYILKNFRNMMDEAITEIWVNQNIPAIEIALEDVKEYFGICEQAEYWEPRTLSETIQHPIVKDIRKYQRLLEIQRERTEQLKQEQLKYQSSIG